MSNVNDKVKALLQTLSVEERQLLTRVLKIEYDVLYMAKPRVGPDLLKAAREIIK